MNGATSDATTAITGQTKLEPPTRTQEYRNPNSYISNLHITNAQNNVPMNNTGIPMTNS